MVEKQFLSMSSETKLNLSEFSEHKGINASKSKNVFRLKGSILSTENVSVLWPKFLFSENSYRFSCCHVVVVQLSYFSESVFGKIEVVHFLPPQRKTPTQEEHRL